MAHTHTHTHTRARASTRTYILTYTDWYFGGWIPYVACLVEPWEGFPAGYAIHFNGETIEQIGHIKDPRSGRLFPLHLTNNCSPNFPNLFDHAQPDIKEELPADVRAAMAAAGVATGVVEAEQKGDGEDATTEELPEAVVVERAWRASRRGAGMLSREEKEEEEEWNKEEEEDGDWNEVGEGREQGEEEQEEDEEDGEQGEEEQEGMGQEM